MTYMRIARIRGLNKNRTPGEWWWEVTQEERDRIEVVMRNTPEDEPIFWDARFPEDNSPHSGFSAIGDLEFIANAPAMIEHLLGIVDEVRAMHQPGQDLRLCRVCGAAGGTWPCDTIRAIGEKA